MSFKKLNLLKMSAFLLFSSLSAVAFAQSNPGSTGIVRISDGRYGVNARANGSLRQVSATDSGTPNQPGSTAPNSGAGASPQGVSGDCPTGNCPTGTCPRCRRPLFNCFCEHYCKHSPDYGYSPPAKYPLHRRGVEYSSYYPNQWYGAGADYSQARFPMVYQPTDTTQLGFYYQHVPFWQPVPGNLPERPIPAQWHIVAPPVSASKFCNGNVCFGAGFGFRRCYLGEEWIQTDPNGQSGTQSPTPIQPPAGGTGAAPKPIETDNPTPLPNRSDDDPEDGPGQTGGRTAPNAGVPLQQVPVRPDSASSGHIRRIGYKN